MSSEIQGRYYEEFAEGEIFTSRGRTVTESDVVQYAGLSWDINAEHTNAEFARRSPFRERIAQQQLGVLIACGLAASLRVLEDTLISVLRLGWNLFNPIKIGDTLHLKQTVSEKRDVSQDGSGLVTFQMETINHRGELVNRCQRTVLVARRPPAGKEAKPKPYVFMGLSELDQRADEPLPVDRLGEVPIASQKSVKAGAATFQDAKQTGVAGVRMRGKYFEEFVVGEELVTQARTVCEADVLNYTILSWDTDPLHTDVEYGRATGYGGTLAPLILPAVFANGLGASLGYLTGTNRGALGDWWEFVRPVRIGDTLHFRQEITAKQEAKEPDTGIVTFGMEMINQRGEVVSRGARSALVVHQPSSQEESDSWHFVFGTAQELAKDQ